MGSKANSPKPIFDNSQLLKIMNDMIRCSDVDDLLKILLNGSWYLMSDKHHCYGWVGKLDRVANKIKIICITPSHAPNLNVREIDYGKGITAQALAEREVKNIPDVSKDNNYIEYWPKTKSEIAIPIMVERVRAVQNLAEDKRTNEKKTETIECRKPIGVLNFESENIGGFSREFHETLMLLCSFAGEVVEKIDRSLKLEALHEIEKNIQKRDNNQKRSIEYDAVMNDLVRQTAKKLSFDIIHLSEVDRGRENINLTCAFSSTYNLQAIEKFKQLARYSIDSQDIQADIVRNGKIEVPEREDPRFNQRIYKEFGHDKCIRVFIPIINPSSNLVVGTLEAGYWRGFDRRMYESDIDLLKRVVDLILKTMERHRTVLINKAIHDVRSPVSAVRSNCSFLYRRVEVLDNNMIRKKAKDMFNNCESLMYSISQLEYALANETTRIPKPDNINIFTEIIVKSIEERRDKLGKEGFICQYLVPDELRSITISTDIAKIMQVMHNLFDNAIKYRSKTNSDSWNMNIEMREATIGKRKFMEIYFYDYGIGINKKNKDLIFDLGFRDPDIIHLVNGSGLGLSIARDLMLELGGSLELISCKDPTTFMLKLPKLRRQGNLVECHRIT
jgi:signal transduction histidine kinase/putative methionine-R-sulfoxide reductase with GAF domain